MKKIEPQLVFEESVIMKKEEEQTDDEQQYDPYARPPNIELCQKHAQANKVGKPLQIDVNQRIDCCPCCGNILDQEPLGLCAGIYDLGILGSGFPLYFRFAIFSIITLFIFCIAGVPAIIKNIYGDQCKKYQSLGLKDKECRESWVTFPSTINRDLEYNGTEIEADEFQGWLNITTCGVLLIAQIIFRYYHEYLKTKIDEYLLTPSDYTVLVRNIPRNKSVEEIKEFFENAAGYHKDVAQVVCAYYIGDYIELRQEKQKLELQNTKLLNLQQRQGKDCAQQQKLLDEQLQQQEDKLKLIESSFETGMAERFTGTAFVTYQYEGDVKDILHKWKMSDTWYILCWWTSSKKFGSNVIQVKQAPEPTDILWENWGYSQWTLIGRRIATEFSTFFVLGICFGIIFGISYAQEEVRKSRSSNLDFDLLLSSLSVASSMMILVVNSMLVIVVKKFALLEKHNTFTNYHISVAKKIGIAQFLNTALLSLAVNSISNGDYIYGEGGLLYDMQYVLIMNAIFPLLFSIFNPFYILRRIRQRAIKSEGIQCNLTQQAANDIFQGPPYDPALKYAAIIKTLLTTAFYAPLLPIGLAVGIVSLFLQFWIEKCLLLKRYARPINLGPELSNEMIDFFMELVLLAFSLGCFYQEQIIYKKSTLGSFSAVILSAVVFILPIDKIFIQKLKCCDCCKFEKDLSTQKFDEVKYDFSSAYDRTNPATMNQALQEWVKLLQNETDNNEKNDQNDNKNKQQQSNSNTGFNALRQFAQMKISQFKQEIGSKPLFQSAIQNKLKISQQKIKKFNPMLYSQFQRGGGIIRQAMPGHQMNQLQQNQYNMQQHLQQFRQFPVYHHPQSQLQPSAQYYNQQPVQFKKTQQNQIHPLQMQMSPPSQMNYQQFQQNQMPQQLVSNQQFVQQPYQRGQYQPVQYQQLPQQISAPFNLQQDQKYNQF